MVFSEPECKDETKRSRVSLSGKGKRREIKNAERFPIEAGYDLEGSPDGTLFFVHRRSSRYRLLHALDCRSRVR
jgi:hypothetical protein